MPAATPAEAASHELGVARLEKSSSLTSGRKCFLNRAASLSDLADRLVAHASADRPQRLLREDGKRLTPNRAEWRDVVQVLVHIQQEHLPHARALPLPGRQRLGEVLLGGRLGCVLNLLHREVEGVGQVVVPLPVALPGIAQPI